MNAVSFFDRVNQACYELPHLSKFLEEQSGFAGIGSMSIGASNSEKERLQHRYTDDVNLRKRALEIIDALPNVRWAICLRRMYIDDWPVGRIAAVLGVSVRTIWNYRRSALTWIDENRPINFDIR